jgi:putative ABC transport system permease protein
MLNDLRYAVRSLLKAKGFALTAIITLALGIGATTAIYSVVHSVILKPLPYPEVEQLITLHTSTDGKASDLSTVAPPDYLDWTRENTSFAEIAASRNDSVNLTGEGEPRRLRGERVTPNYWQVYGIAPFKGNVFTADSIQTNGDAVAVISHDLWQSEFGGRPDIIGHVVQLDGRAVTIVAVMPVQFQSGDRRGIWTPLVFTEREKSDQTRGSQFLRAVGRLKPGVTLTTAQSEMTVIAQRIAQAYPDTNKGVTITLQPLIDNLLGNLRPVLYTLLAAVGALLLIACVNVANLLLARALGRMREISVRAALGASPARIIRQMLTESVVLAIIGGCLGLLVANWGLDALLAMMPAGLPRAQEIQIDGPVLLITTGIVLVCGLLFGLVPAMQAARLSLGETLKDGGRGNTSAGHNRLRNGLVIAEIALALTLLISGTMLMQSFLRLMATSPGFRIVENYNFGVSLPATRYDTPEKQLAFIDNVTERIRALPGVESVGTVHAMPLAGSSWALSFLPDTQPALAQSDWPGAGYYMVSPDYFRAIGIPLLNGRTFNEGDHKDSPPVAIISRSLADQYFPGMNPIGRRIAISNTDGTVWREIVGVVGDVKQRNLENSPTPQLYEPVAQQTWGSMGVVIHAPHAPAGLADALRHTLRQIDPDLPLIGLGTVEQLVAKSVSQRQFFTFLLGVFTLIALILASVGIYGVMAYSVNQRTAEYGVRIALGATPGSIRNLVLGRAGILLGAGFAVGTVAAMGTGQLLASLLFEVSPFTPGPYLIAMTIFGVIALAACYIPARRATRVDPITALRAE